jgi:ABC-type bacteriocin/lantibiotic exporter with double-glycine peptidase domain
VIGWATFAFMNRRAILAFLFGAHVCGRASEGGVWLDVPFVRQPKEGCGAAVVWMTMQYWRSAVVADVGEIHAVIYSRGQKGAPAGKVADYLTAHGFRTFQVTGAWRDLQEQIKKGRPLILCLRPQVRAPLHYVVAAGVGEDAVWVNDPADRKLRRMERAAFEKAWARGGNWMLLAVPAAGE